MMLHIQEEDVKCVSCGEPVGEHQCPKHGYKSERSAGSESRSSEWVEEADSGLRYLDEADREICNHNYGRAEVAIREARCAFKTAMIRMRASSTGSN